MKVVTVHEMRALEEAALKEGWTEESLMQAAGERLALAISWLFPQAGTIIAYTGKGHNAGDAYVALRVLRDRYHWTIGVRAALPEDQWALLTRSRFEDLKPVELLDNPPTWETNARPLVLLDALVGIGARGALRHPLAGLALEIGWLRNHTGAKVIALDLPSGVDPDTGEIFPDAVVADATLMIGSPKAGLLHGHLADITGTLHVVTVPLLASGIQSRVRLISPFSIHSRHDPRPFDFHKGMAGRVGILAGSRRYAGAAILAAMGALRAGAGLVTLHLPEDVIPMICGRIPPEVILHATADPREILKHRYDALVIGCGLHSNGEDYTVAVREVIHRSVIPTVVDAEALNFLSGDDLAALRDHHLLTPHPGEFRRLAPDLTGQTREAAARAFSDRTASTLLLKGARTIVTRQGDPLWINPTGTPGMATGGQGDLLSGVLGALLAIGNPALDAAAIGAWICGRAAERALLEPAASPQSLLPTDVANHVGGAFRDWAERTR